MRARELERMLKQDGWQLKNIKGSHRQYVHPEKPGKVTIPFHPGDLNKRTEKSILEQAGLK
ncbi:type II toxin-antitoxin system HicA family toxin [Mogibacterium sp.]|uniref:type II toxin-antitoxin system HicA family toxin n=1 Tax=Mogibacterium sp. TaxID=2049035 RepID=UPI00257C5435|nr:type II toxin-antitoxin system HicA family toxin [Mogibacterium sp.]MBN2935642.1 type II toxin-antitoxin system HicA family toxin [Mogibacterium sp.]